MFDIRSLISIGLLVGLVFTLYTFLTFSSGTATGYAVSAEPLGDIFEGRITNMEVNPGEIVGTGVYDRNCQSMGGGLTNCDAGIRTDEYGVLNFNYIHNMQIDPCIAPGQKLLVSIIDSDGSATVQRY